jgi:hypothetical protein
MNAEQHAMATTEREINDAYRDLHRMLKLGQIKNAVDQAVRLANQDETRLWNYLRAYPSTDIGYREVHPLLVVNVLWNNWQAEKELSFVSHAVLTLANAPKGESALDFYTKNCGPA